MGSSQQEHKEEFVLVQVDEQGEPIAHFRVWSQTVGDVQEIVRFRTRDNFVSDPRDGTHWLCGTHGRTLMHFRDMGIDLPLKSHTFNSLSEMYDSIGYDMTKREFSGENRMKSAGPRV